MELTSLLIHLVVLEVVLLPMQLQQRVLLVAQSLVARS
jgi:hypothetical protein